MHIHSAVKKTLKTDACVLSCLKVQFPILHNWTLNAKISCAKLVFCSVQFNCMLHIHCTYICKCKRDLKSSDLKGKMSHTPLTSGALARICQVAALLNVKRSIFKKETFYVNMKREKMFMSPCCKFLVRRWSQAVVRKGELLFMTTSNSPDSFHLSYPQLRSHKEALIIMTVFKLIICNVHNSFWTCHQNSVTS